MVHFKKLKAWQHARTLAILSHGFIKRLPDSERNALGDQWRRAAYSIALNIAEGSSRRGPREFRRFVEFARASLDEVEAILDLVRSMEYFRPEELAKIEAVRDECGKTVYGLMRKLGEAPKRS